jgi:hypothetical protein
MGMRGEADTAIMGKEATFADNVNLLRDVLRTQNKLIKEYVNQDLDKVPRMLALYKEVEPFFYGDGNTPGLMGSEELENVIIMLCDDNFGNLRTLPTEEMLTHKGGYGMYYHFDYHGWPISFEWINSSYLPKIWEQMSMAYDFGVRDLWVVNVGDICTQEFPLAYFLDLAYDFDKWGTSAVNKTEEYTKLWIRNQFGGMCKETDLEKIYDILDGYTKIAHNRRPEAMSGEVYHPVHYQETDRLLLKIEELMDKASELYYSIEKDIMPGFFSLVYYPAMGNLNLQKMQLLTGRNHYAARLNSMEANHLAEQIKACMKRDQELVEEYHAMDNGKWYGMGLSEHIGFVHWNEDECRNPIVMQVIPARKPRLIVSVDGTGQYTEGSSWLVNTLNLNDFRQPDIKTASFTISSVSDLESSYEITCLAPWMSCSNYSGILDGTVKAVEKIVVEIDRSKMGKDISANIVVKIPSGVCTIIVDARIPELSDLPDYTYIDTNGYISIEAEHYFAKGDKGPGGKMAEVSGRKCREEIITFQEKMITSQTNILGGQTLLMVNQTNNITGFRRIDRYGKTLSGMKVFPSTCNFTVGKDAPYLEYRFFLEAAGTYTAELYMQPSNPAAADNTLYYGIQVNDGHIEVVNTIPEGQKVGDHNHQWAAGVLDNIRRHSSEISCNEGTNKIRIYAVSPGFVLEKLVIYPTGKNPLESYLGPTETYYIGKD